MGLYVLFRNSSAIALTYSSPLSLRLYCFEGDPVNAGSALVGFDKMVGVLNDVLPIHLVVEGIKPELSPAWPSGIVSSEVPGCVPELLALLQSPHSFPSSET